MRQTLLRIPLDAPWSFGSFEVPGFGFGVVLLIWIVVAVAWLYRFRKDLRIGPEFIPPVVVWLGIAALIVKLPDFTQREPRQVIASASEAIDAGQATTAAWLARGRAYFAVHQYAEAAADFRKAMELDPQSVEAPRELAWTLATAPDHAVRDGAAAVAAADVAIERGSARDGWSLDAMAAAQAENGQFETAVATARQAASLANDSQDPQLASRVQGIRERISRYRQSQPWRESRIGKAIPVYGYGFMLFLGFFAAGWTATRRARAVGIAPELVWDVALWVFFSGIAGARLFYIFQYPERVFGNRQGFGKLVAVFNLPDGGLVLYGGVLLGIVVYVLYCRHRRLNSLQLADALVPSVFLGVAFGRVGCFLNGCCYGDRCDLPWGVEFPVGSVPDLSMVSRGYLSAGEVVSRIALHPTQIYSAIDGLILSFVTAIYFRCRPRPGSVTLLALFCYPITRFLIEYLRSDEPSVLVPVRQWLFAGDVVTQIQTPFTISQWVSIGMLVACGACAWWWNRNPATGSRQTARPSITA